MMLPRSNRLTRPLIDDLLGGLGRDAAELLQLFLRFRDLDDPFLVGRQAQCAGLVGRDLEIGVRDFVDDLLPSEHGQGAAVPVEASPQVFLRAEIFLGGGGVGVLDGLDDDVDLDPLLASDLFDGLKDLAAHESTLPAALAPILDLNLEPGLGHVAPGDVDRPLSLQDQADRSVDQPDQTSREIAAPVDRREGRQADPTACESGVIPVGEQGTVETWRRDLERVALRDGILDVELGRKLPADPGAVVQRHPPLLVDIEAQEPAASLSLHLQMDHLHACEFEDPPGDLPDAVQRLLVHRPLSPLAADRPPGAVPKNKKVGEPAAH